MYLVDTSVWVDYFREKETAQVKHFINILDQKRSFGITGLIFQEIVQGSATQADYKKLSEYLTTQVFYHLKDPLLSYQAAAEIYFNCRKKGLTIRSTVDCLIAQVAIEHDLILLHSDKDFLQINQVIPQLKLYSHPSNPL